MPPGKLGRDPTGAQVSAQPSRLVLCEGVYCWLEQGD